jgi:MFS superfamily sulfate permease-like transporter
MNWSDKRQVENVVLFGDRVIRIETRERLDFNNLREELAYGIVVGYIIRPEPEATPYARFAGRADV